ncbi:hemoblobin-interacting domain-containing protein [Bacillus sp. FJAT-42315]|uniref:hemoblobin-interacting domain-containing protein n=1 Tax=Bacillus sp. FJAT-42315 TaxID=2014077 RepID=UPI000C23A4A4
MDGSTLYIDFDENEEWRTSIESIEFAIGVDSGIIPPEFYNLDVPGRIIINGAPPFEIKFIIKATDYQDRIVMVNEGIEPPPLP